MLAAYHLKIYLNGQRGLDFTTAVNKRGEMTRQLRDKTITWWLMSHQQRFGMGQPVYRQLCFGSRNGDGTTKKVRGERIFINTGAVPNWPSIPGLEFGQRILRLKKLWN